jgi:hypothetical protein
MYRRILLTIVLGSAAGFGQTRELGLMLGRIAGPTRSTPDGSRLDLSSGLALEANFGYRFARTGRLAWLAEVHGLANGLRDIHSPVSAATRDVATAYITPGLRLKYLAAKHFSPYGALGGGYALYEQSFYRIDGAGNQASRFTHRGAFDYGGGADFPVKRWIGGRVEVRDFFTGSPAFNVPLARGG